MLAVACTPAAPAHEACTLQIPTPEPAAGPIGPLNAPSGVAHRLWLDPLVVSGPSREVPEPMAVWEGGALDRGLGVDACGPVWTSPNLLHLATPAFLELELAAGPSGSVDVMASIHQVPTDEDRMMRTQRITVPASTEGATVRVPIAHVVEENWGDDRAPMTLARVEVRGTPVGTGRLVGVRLLDDEQADGAALAVRSSLSAEDVRRPGWRVYGGGSLRVTARVPPGGGSLQASLSGDGMGVVRVNGEERLLARPTSEWTPVTVDLTRWAGEEVTLDIGASSGTVSVGAPRLVPSQVSGTNVLVYLVDTLRADHVGWLSSEASVTPNLDALADDGVLFARAFSTGSWTKPVIPTVLTGLGPMQHGVGLTGIADRLPSDIPTLADALGSAGYRVGSFSASPMGSTLSGLERGFDVAVPPSHWSGRLGRLGHPSARQVHEQLIDWVDARPDQPWAAYVHVLEPHAWANAMYSDGPDTPYRAAVSDWDDAFAELVQALSARGQLEDTLVVFLSDHGESFGEHGLTGHGTGLVPQQTHVPMMMWHADRLPRAVVDEPVSVADVTPTVLALLGLPGLPDTLGHSLGGVVSGTPAVRGGVGAARLRFVQRPDDPARFAWVSASHHMLLRGGTATRSVDLSIDGCGYTTTSPDDDDIEALSRWRRSEQAGWRRPTVRAATPSDTALLQALGYVDP